MKGVRDAFRKLSTLNNDPGIQVDGAFVHGIATEIKDKKAHIYYDQNGGSFVKAINITPETPKYLPEKQCGLRLRE